MIHVIAKQITSASKFDDSHRICIFRIDVWSTMICCHHASAKFAREIWILPFTLCHLFLLCTELFCSNGSTAAKSFKIESLVIVARCRFEASVPKAVSIVAIQRYHLAIRHRRAQFGPPSTCVERQVEANTQSYLLKSH